ncbi:MAG: phospholipid carrier-dependent glycosyltransferase [Candidatus Dormiibacterota bacterium]
MIPTPWPMVRREWPFALGAAVLFALVAVLLRWPVNPLVALVMAAAVWGLSLLLRRHRTLTGVDGWDCVIAGVLVAAALTVRLASPIYLDFLQGHVGITGTVAAPTGVHRSPTHDVLGVGAWGLGYPFNSTGCTQAPVGPGNSERNTCGFVFDEVYFPVDALKDLKGIDYFDPEPPLTKLLIAGGISWLGFDPWGWRIMSAILGSLVIGVIYFMARRLWRRSRVFPTLAGLFLSLDGLELVESRTGVIDVIAVFFVMLAYWMFLLHWHARTPGQWRWTLYLTAVASGLGLACKADMVPAVALMVVLLLARWVRPRLRLRWGRGGVARWVLPPAPDDPVEATRRTMVRHLNWSWHYLAAGAVILFLFYASFFRYWTTPHTLYVNFANTQGPTATCTGLFEKASVCQLPVAMPLHEYHIGSVDFWLPTGFNPVQSIADVEWNSLGSLSYQATLKATHPFASPFYSWPVGAHPVLFYATYSGNGVSTVNGQTVSNYTWISDMGNPAILWLGLLALVWCLFLVVRRRDRVAAFILLAFLFDWLLLWSWPSRILFFYEYIEALPFVCLALAYACSRLLRAQVVVQLDRARLGSLSLAPLGGAVVLAVVLCFAYFYPLWTGQPIASSNFFQHIWVPGWY